jgi:hypothetical protein
MALPIDVDPLAVPGQVGEVVDHLLGHLEWWTEVAELVGRKPSGPRRHESGRVRLLLAVGSKGEGSPPVSRALASRRVLTRARWVRRHRARRGRA